MMSIDDGGHLPATVETYVCCNDHCWKCTDSAGDCDACGGPTKVLYRAEPEMASFPPVPTNKLYPCDSCGDEANKNRYRWNAKEGFHADLLVATAEGWLCENCMAERDWSNIRDERWNLGDYLRVSIRELQEDLLEITGAMEEL